MLGEEPRAVDRGPGKTALRNAHRVPPRTTTEIEHLAPTDAGEPDDLLHLFIADGKSGFRECERIEILPDRFVGEPLVVARSPGESIVAVNRAGVVQLTRRDRDLSIGINQ